MAQFCNMLNIMSLNQQCIMHIIMLWQCKGDGNLGQLSISLQRGILDDIKPLSSNLQNRLLPTSFQCERADRGWKMCGSQMGSDSKLVKISIEIYHNIHSIKMHGLESSTVEPGPLDQYLVVD